MKWQEWDNNIDTNYLYILKSEINLYLWVDIGDFDPRDSEYIEAQPKISYHLLYRPYDFDYWINYININHHPGYYFSYMKIEKYHEED